MMGFLRCSTDWAIAPAVAQQYAFDIKEIEEHPASELPARMFLLNSVLSYCELDECSLSKAYPVGFS